MLKIVRVLRWLGAVIVAALVFNTAMNVGEWLWHQITRQTFTSTDWQVGFASFWAIIAGTVVVARADRPKAALALWFLALLPPLWYLMRNVLLAGHLMSNNVIETAGVLLAGLPVYVAARIADAKIPR